MHSNRFAHLGVLNTQIDSYILECLIVLLMHSNRFVHLGVFNRKRPLLQNRGCLADRQTKHQHQHQRRGKQFRGTPQTMPTKCSIFLERVYCIRYKHTVYFTPYYRVYCTRNTTLSQALKQRDISVTCKYARVLFACVCEYWVNCFLSIFLCSYWHSRKQNDIVINTISFKTPD